MELKTPVFARDLVASERTLLDSIRAVGFGRIEHMRVVAGQPVLETMEVVHDFKLGARSPIRATDRQDFGLTKEVADLFAVLRTLENTTVRCIKIFNGSPTHLEVEGDLRSAESGDSNQTG